MPEPLNILWIQFDEVRADAFSCYEGNPWVAPQTPNVQALAGQGIVFENAFCPSPVCTASRGAELTSQYVTTLGVYHNITKRLRERARFDTAWLSWPNVLRDAGYRAVNVGKSHTVAYDIWDENLRCPQFPPVAELKQRREELDLSILPGVDLIVGGTYPLDGNDYESFGARRLTRLGLEKLDELQGAGQPWLLRMSYLAPHTPVIAPPPHDSTGAEAGCKFDPDRDVPHNGMSAYERSVTETQQSGAMSPREVARARATYFGLCNALDAEVGLLLQSIPDGTIVLLTGDHGAMQGEMGLWQKQVFHRKVHQVPFILRAPGLAHARRSDNIDLLDVGPTLLSLCGMDVPEVFAGRDLFGTGLPAKDIYGAFGFGDEGSFLYEALFRGPGCPRRICIRSGHHRLDLSIRRNGQWLEGEDQDLFYCCTGTDPEERHNAAADPANAAIVNQLRSRLIEWHTRTHTEAT